MKQNIRIWTQWLERYFVAVVVLRRLFFLYYTSDDMLKMYFCVSHSNTLTLACITPPQQHQTIWVEYTNKIKMIFLYVKINIAVESIRSNANIKIH